VTVEFSSDEGGPWDFPEKIPAHGEQEMLTPASAGVSSMAVRVSAEGRPSMVGTVQAPDDPQVWRIHESFCRT